MVASGPTQAKPAAATLASVNGSGSASASSNGSPSTPVTVIMANSSRQPNTAASVAGRDAPPSTGAHATLAAFASPAPEASPNQDQSFYQRLLAKLPFAGSDEAQDRSRSAETDRQDALDPQAPLPPIRPATLSRNTGPRPAAPQAGLAPGLDLFSSHRIFTALPSFMKGSAATSPTTATGFAPLDP
jgi:hypothetical protein